MNFPIYSLIFFVNFMLGIHSRDVIPGEVEEHLRQSPAEAGFRQVERTCDAQPAVKNYNYDFYMKFNQIEEWLKYMECKYRSLITLSIIGRSVEDRPIYMMKISQKSKKREVDAFVPAEASFKEATSRFLIRDTVSNPPIEDLVINEADPSVGDFENRRINSSPKDIIFIDALIHAREWVAGASVMKIIEEVVKDPFRSNLDMLDYWIVPVLNPDGYIYSHTTDRMWRKNRAKLAGTNCIGVDLNRNFDVHWKKTSRDQCSLVYGGPSPFSEPEAKALKKVLLKGGKKIKGYVTLHSYGKLILHPFGYTKNLKPRTANVLASMGNTMADAMYKKFGLQSNYKVEQASFLGAAAGGSDDWAFLAVRIPFSFTFELPPDYVGRTSLRRSGFLLPEHRIHQATKEAWTAIEALATRIATSPQMRSFLRELDEERGGSEPSECYDMKGNILVCPHLPFNS